MKKLILITAVFVFAVSTIVAAEVGFVNFGSVTRLQTGTGTSGAGMSFPRGYTGVMAIQPTSACSAFINLTTLTRTKAGIGYPLAANTQYQFNIPQKNSITFTCATSAPVKYIYIAR